MNKAALEARRAYRRAWAKANPEKVKATQERYWQRKAEKMAAAAISQAEPAKTTEG